MSESAPSPLQYVSLEAGIAARHDEIRETLRSELGMNNTFGVREIVEQDEGIYPKLSDDILQTAFPAIASDKFNRKMAFKGLVVAWRIADLAQGLPDGQRTPFPTDEVIPQGGDVIVVRRDLIARAERAINAFDKPATRDIVFDMSDRISRQATKRQHLPRIVMSLCLATIEEAANEEYFAAQFSGLDDSSDLPDGFRLRSLD